MAMTVRTTPTPTDSVSGIRVEVRNRLTGSWCTGFEISEVVDPAPNATYRLRRLSDGIVLPGTFGEEHVRFVT